MQKSFDLQDDKTEALLKLSHLSIDLLNALVERTITEGGDDGDSTEDSDSSLNQEALMEFLYSLDEDYNTPFMEGTQWSTINDKSRYKTENLSLDPKDIDLMSLLTVGRATQKIVLFGEMALEVRSLSSSDISFLQLWGHEEEKVFEERDGSPSTSSSDLDDKLACSPNSARARNLALQVMSIGGNALGDDPIALLDAGNTSAAVAAAKAARTSLLGMDANFVQLITLHVEAFNDRLSEAYNPTALQNF